MLFLIKRFLIVSVLLTAVHLGLPGEAGSEPWRDSALPLSDSASEEIRLASLGESPDSVALDLGLVPSPVKREPEPVSSDPLRDADSREDTEISRGPLTAPVPSAVSRPPIELRPEVRHYLDRFQTGYRRAVVERWLSRSGRYGEMIRDVLVQKGLPEELIFTAMIESGFDPLAASRAGAKGLWQFMASTARRYGLRVDRWLDERLDPEKSTWAAASYLRDLYAMFGSWHLVQAAYNAGEMKVTRAIQGTRTSDFWELARTRLLAEETKNFVAAIQAATLIGREPDRYGFSITLEDPVRYDVVRVPPATSLKKLAAQSGVGDGELRRLNPELRLGQTPPGEAYTLKVPVGAGGDVKRALRRRDVAPDPVAAGGKAARVTAKTAKGPIARPAPPEVHVVKPQETVGSIARRYGVSPVEIARWNRLAESDRIFPGDRLRVASLAPAERPSNTDDGWGGFR